MQIASIGIHLGKATFHFVALDHHGKVIIQKKFSRKHLLSYTANLAHSLIDATAQPNRRSRELRPWSRALMEPSSGWSARARTAAQENEEIKIPEKAIDCREADLREVDLAQFCK